MYKNCETLLFYITSKQVKMLYNNNFLTQSIVEKIVRPYLWFIHGNICTTSDEDCCNTLSFSNIVIAARFSAFSFFVWNSFLLILDVRVVRIEILTIWQIHAVLILDFIHFCKKDQLHFLFLNLSQLLQNISFITILKCNCQRKYQLKASSSVDLSFKINIKNQ